MSVAGNSVCGWCYGRWFGGESGVAAGFVLNFVSDDVIALSGLSK